MKNYRDVQDSDLKTRLLQLQYEKKQRGEDTAEIDNLFGKNGLKIKKSSTPRKMFRMGSY